MPSEAPSRPLLSAAQLGPRAADISRPMMVAALLVASVAGGVALALPGLVGELAGATVAGVVTVGLIGILRRRIGLVRRLGLDTLAAVLVPSCLAYVGWIGPGAVGTIGAAMRGIEVLDVFVSIVIVGSILSIDSRILVIAPLKLALPVFAASLVAAAAGAIAGVVIGSGAHDALFFIAAPVMGGGLAAGAIPLSAGFAGIAGIDPGEVLVRLLPTILVGNLCAVIAAVLISFVDPPPQDDDLATPPSSARPIGAPHSLLQLSLGVASIACLYLASRAAAGFGIPQPLTLFVGAALLNLTRVLPEPMRAGIAMIYTLLTGPLLPPFLFLVGLSFVPWPALLAGFAPSVLAVTAAVVIALAGSGIALARFTGFPTSDGATILLGRAAMGGTGDVIILSAGRRMRLMPFVQLVTRLGGWATIVAAIMLYGIVT